MGSNFFMHYKMHYKIKYLIFIICKSNIYEICSIKVPAPLNNQKLRPLSRVAFFILNIKLDTDGTLPVYKQRRRANFPDVSCGGSGWW